MITKNEISSLNLSPTKKDFVQIWNELIEVASKITERWDPTSTNESDPGIVLLKALTGIADKLNYNIDKNILEAYMPTAAQMESMRKLCELVGYDIKYYQSAETRVKISYTGNTADGEDNDEKLPDGGLALPKFTTITNADKDITFVTTNAIPMLITNSNPWVEVPCIEGQISQCESINENNLITLAQLDANNRYYLPEIQIAENGIFVYNAATAIVDSTATLIDGTAWTQVSNLNAQSSETRVFKFGYDSFEGRPYLAFPDDVGSLIGDGLFIYFVRTSGLNGNISPRTLEVLEIPSGKHWEDYSAEQFEVVNVDATTNGANIESISAAYNNFKKTVGTFDTLVTCRDYMNKIYSLMDASNSPYVSNILVTDIRNDINKAITLCSCNEFGILYKETPLTNVVQGTSVLRTVKEVTDEDGNKVNRLYIDQNHETVTEVPLIDHFDLLLYPFKTFTQVSSGTTDLVGPYNRSFTYTEQMNREIEASLADLKTCAHNITTPAKGDIVTINNYLRLDALIATSLKVSALEAEDILQKVKVALVNEFNLRNLDFGEEIPFDSILSVIENADSRIKVVSLQEPTVLTTYSVKVQAEGGATSKEYGIASTASLALADPAKSQDRVSGVDYEDSNASKTAKEIYNKLVLRNILAGRASLFDYDETFIPNNSEKPYTVTETISLEGLDVAEYSTPGEFVLQDNGPNGGVITLRVSKAADGTIVKEAYETFAPALPVLNENGQPLLDENKQPVTIKDNVIDNITRVEAVCEIHNKSNTFRNIKLDKNEVIKFRAPNLITTKTFPAYVYYRYEKGATALSNGAIGGNKAGKYADAVQLTTFINQYGVPTFFESLWNLAEGAGLKKEFTVKKPNSSAEIDQSNELQNIFNSAIAVGADTNLNSNSSNIYTDIGNLRADLSSYFEKPENFDKKVIFSYCPLNNGTLATWGACVRAFKQDLPAGTTLWRLSTTNNYPMGKLVTSDGRRLFAQSGDFLANSFVGEVTYICTDHGANPEFASIEEHSDIELGANDKLYIHYTPSSTNEDGETVTAEPISKVYQSTDEAPIIIKPSGFTLMHSEDVVRSQGISWKKTGVYFEETGETKDLLSLAPNEQIELRSISKVVLNTPARFYKNFSNDGLENGTIKNYELKDGEYIFYTDQNTQEAAYYGSGSVITLDNGAFIPKATETVEVSQILEQGLHIVPWSNYVILNNDKKVTVTEYQYVTLVEGDTLNTLTVRGEDGTEGYTISNARWTACESNSSITYTPVGSDTPEELPKISLNSSTSTSWEVCSFLELSTSPGHAQSLRASGASAGSEQAHEAAISDTIDTVSIVDKINVYSSTNTGDKRTTVIMPVQTAIPGSDATAFEKISIKLDTVAQVASGGFNAVDDTKLQMKIFKEDPPSIIELEDLNDTITPISNKTAVPADTGSDRLNNYWTKIDIESRLMNASGKPNALKLNFMIPEAGGADVFGIFSIYLEVPEDRLDSRSVYNIPVDSENIHARVFIDIPEEYDSDAISIFNYDVTIRNEETGENDRYSWWPDGVDKTRQNRLYLRAGLNCIKVTKSCSLLIKAQEDAAGSFLYDNMRLVKGRATNGVNLALLDPDTTFNAKAARVAEVKDENEKKAFEETKVNFANAILSKINTLDENHDFYYNVPIENSLAIEFDNNISSLSNPYTLYDINNINNSFVVSKLDVKYLDDGLKIAKSSKY